MSLDFRTVYKLSPLSNEGESIGEPQIVMGAIQITTAGLDGWWFVRAFSGRGEATIYGTVVAEHERSVIVQAEAYQWLFEPLTNELFDEMASGILNFEELRKAIQTNGDIQTFYWVDWMGPLEDLGLEAVRDEVVRMYEGRGFDDGTTRTWKSGDVVKTKGKWIPVGKRGKAPAPAAPASSGSGGAAPAETPAPAVRAAEYNDDDPPGLGPGGSWDKHFTNGVPSRERMKLHDQILSNIFRDARPVPQAVAPIAVMTVGIPGAGKSRLIENSADLVPPSSAGSGIAHIDTDRIRKQLPEFREGQEAKSRKASAAVQKEAAWLADKALETAVGKNVNLIFEGVGANTSWTVETAKNLISKGYNLSVVGAEASVAVAMKRNITRASQGGHETPEDYIRKSADTVPKTYDELQRIATNSVLTDTEDGTVLHRKTEGADEVAHARLAQFLDRAKDKKEAVAILLGLLRATLEAVETPKSKKPPDIDPNVIIDAFLAFYAREAEAIDAAAELPPKFERGAAIIDPPLDAIPPK